MIEAIHKFLQVIIFSFHYFEVSKLQINQLRWPTLGWDEGEDNRAHYNLHESSLKNITNLSFPFLTQTGILQLHYVWSW